MLTICSCPKAWRGEIATIQTNAVRSWRRLGCEVVLIGNDEGVADAAELLGTRHAPEVERNDHGTPLVSSILATIRRTAPTDLVCLVNSDIILTGDVVGAAGVAARLGQFLLVGERRNAEIGRAIDFDSDWMREIELLPYKPGRRARDYFIFRRDMFAELPPFAVGRGRWDTFLVGESLACGIPVVDATQAVTAIHQNHDFAHIPGSTIRRGRWGYKGQEFDSNLSLIPPGHLSHGRLWTTHTIAHDLTLRAEIVRDG